MRSKPKVSCSGSKGVGVTIVVPCFNEEASLALLKDRLAAARALLGPKYVVHLILVDDASTDDTRNQMCRLFAHEPNCTFLQHPVNLGLGAAILSGIRAARTEVVCSIDADCSYDACELEKLISLFKPNVDMVTASPYHPAGRVIDVPGWRLFFSRAASLMYRQILGQKLHTYTSCFRVYRRGSILKVHLRRHDFLAVAELIGKLDLQGAIVAECPATLRTRRYGRSKMNVARVLFGHFHLLTELLCLRIWQALVSRPRPYLQSIDLSES